MKTMFLISLAFLAFRRRAEAALFRRPGHMVSGAGSDNFTATMTSSNRSSAWWQRAEAWRDWGDEDVDSKVMSGYTDCTSQSPPQGPKANHAWWDARSGNHAAGRSCVNDDRTDSCSKPVQVPAVNGLGFCWITKNGCSFWKSLFMRMDNNPLWNSPRIMDVHTTATNRLIEDARVLKAPNGLVVMVVRNPVVRVLSAWLDKRRDNKIGDVFKSHPEVASSFAKFVDVIAPQVAQHTANRHWGRQVDMCSLRYGARYDVYLKAECRTLWGPSLFEHKGMQPWTDSGWGPNGAEPFIRDDRQAVAESMTSDTSNTKVAQPATTQHRGSLKQGHNTRADSLNKVCSHYTTMLFQRVSQLFSEDIRRFGYAADVQRIARACGF